MLHQIALALTTCWDGLKSLVRATLVGPIALYALAQMLYIGIIVNFHHPLISGAMAPAVRILGGSNAVHYPQLFAALPAIFNRGSLLLAATVGAYVWGVAVIAVTNHFEGTSGAPWRDALRRFPHLFLAQLPVIVIVLGTFLVTDALTGPELGGNAKRLVLYGPIPFSILVESIFLFAPIAVIVEGLNAGQAIARSFSIWRSNVVTALLLVGLTTLPHVPTYMLYLRTGDIIQKFSPETMVLVVGGDVVLRILTNVVLLVAATLVLLDTMRKEPA